MVTADRFLKDNTRITSSVGLSLRLIACKIIALKDQTVILLFRGIYWHYDCHLWFVSFWYFLGCKCILPLNVTAWEKAAIRPWRTDFVAPSLDTVFNLVPACDLQCLVQGQNVTWAPTFTRFSPRPRSKSSREQTSTSQTLSHSFWIFIVFLTGCIKRSRSFFSTARSQTCDAVLFLQSCGTKKDKKKKKNESHSSGDIAGNTMVTQCRWAVESFEHIHGCRLHGAALTRWDDFKKKTR